MIGYVIYAMVFLGAALMAYNVYCYVRFARFLRGRKGMAEKGALLSVPTILLIMFLLGYLVVGIFGKPDIVMGGILFGGSIFVYLMYRFMDIITQQLVKNEQQEAELIAAEESNRAKTRFLASISHEMRTPMNVIIGLDTIALKNPRLPGETRTQLEKIGYSAQHLLDLITNILDINSIEAGDFTVHRGNFSLEQTWDQLNAIAGTLCDEKGLEYRTHIGKRAMDWYVGDRTLIKQVIITLIDNAVKFTDAPGTVSLSINVTVNAKGGLVLECAVADTGVGISRENLESIFGLFGQEDASSTSRFSGSGLGLAAAKSKVDLMGGEIAVTSEKGLGSTFTVTVPLEASELRGSPAPHDIPMTVTPDTPAAQAETENMPAQDASSGTPRPEADASGEGEAGAHAPEPADEPASAPASPEPDGDQSILEGKLILIVEDVDENAEIAADLLELEGAESERAENGQVALEMFEASPEFRYDAVLMDLRMPVMDGLEATRRIRALKRSDAKTVPILALTANAFESDVRQSLQAGMNVHLAKPVDADQLYESLERLIRQMQAERTGDTK